MGNRAIQERESFNPHHFISHLEKKLTTLLNAIYCEEDIYMHPYRKCLSLKEWKLTYIKSKVDFSRGFRISPDQFETLMKYSRRLSLLDSFRSIGFINAPDGSYEIGDAAGVEYLHTFLEKVHTSGR